MKKKIRFLILVLLCITCIFSYIDYDSEGFDYGLGCTFCNKKLPYNIKPHANSIYLEEFALLGDDGFELVGSGFKFKGSNVLIKKISEYGYNDTSVVIICLDSTNRIKYLTSYVMDLKNEKGRPLISFKDIEDSYFQQIKKNYVWLKISEEEINRIRFIKTISLVCLITLLILIIRLILKSKSNGTRPLG